MTDSNNQYGPHFTTALNLLDRARYDKVVTLFTTHPPQTPFEEWILRLALRSQEDGHTHELPEDPPTTLVLMLASGYHEHGHDDPIRHAIKATTDLPARIGFLKYAMLPGPAGRADVSLLTTLLEAQLELGDLAGMEDTLAHPNLRLDADDQAFIRALGAVRAASNDPTMPFEVLVTQVQALPAQAASNTREIVLRLNLAALAAARGRPDDAFTMLRDTFKPLNIPNHFTTLDKDYVRTTNATASQSWGVELPGVPEALAFLDDVIADEHFPNDVRGMALLLRRTGDPDPDTSITEEELEQARTWLGDTLWVRSLKEFNHPLEYIRHTRAWAIDVVGAYGTDVYLGWPNPPRLPEGLTLSREEALELHALLMHWPELFEEGDTAQYKHRLRFAAWPIVWKDALDKHELNHELVRAAQTILEDDLAVDKNVRRNALFTIGYHSDKVRTPTMLNVAAEAYEQYLAEYGPAHFLLNNLGLVRERQGQYQQADAWYRQALELDPGNEITLRNLRRVQPPAPLETLNAQGIRLEFKSTTSSKDRVVTLAYWARTPTGWMNTLKTLNGHYGLTNTSLKTTVANSGQAYTVNHTCADCEKQLELSDRQSLEKLNSDHGTWVCGTCTEKRKLTRKTQQAQLHQRQVEAIRERFDLTDVPAVTEDLFTFEDAVFLVALIRHAASEDLRVIASLSEQPPGLAPTPDFAVEIVRRLHERNLLHVHPASTPDAFTWEDDRISAFTWTKVRWGLPMGGQQLPFGTLADALEARLRAGPDAWPADWVADADALGRRVVLYEALRYLTHVMAEYHFTFSPGEKTHLVLRNVLEDYSLAQTWSILWSNAKSAAAYYQKGGIPKAQAANSVVARIQSYAERAQAEGWMVRFSRRNYDIPMPVVSEVLFTMALGLGVRYQELRPKEWLTAASGTATSTA